MFLSRIVRLLFIILIRIIILDIIQHHTWYLFLDFQLLRMYLQLYRPTQLHLHLPTKLIKFPKSTHVVNKYKYICIACAPIVEIAILYDKNYNTKPLLMSNLGGVQFFVMQSVSTCTKIKMQTLFYIKHARLIDGPLLTCYGLVFLAQNSFIASNWNWSL